MYSGNAYLRAFKPGLRARTVVDLGSNRALFLMLALTVESAKNLGLVVTVGLVAVVRLVAQ